MDLNLGGRSIALDSSSRNANTFFVSHAHSDHTSGVHKGKEILASEETIELLKARKSIELKRQAPPNGFELIDSGHILGSKQLYINSDDLGYSIVYTGDYQLQKTCVAQGIEIKHADIALIDSTYPYLKVRFDEREEVEEAIRVFANRKLEQGIVLFGAYSLGKAQEIIKILNKDNILPVVDKNISAINTVYKKFGIELEYASVYEDENLFKEVTRGNFAGIVSMNNLNDLKIALAGMHNKRIFTAVATGFAKISKFNTDVQFPLSDHADIYQAAEYIERSGAKHVYAYGSGASEMVNNLNKMGYDAKVFGEMRLLQVEGELASKNK
ncbi:MAG: hypothetical protein ACP5FN_01395 [Candidatus Micrarchaeia archaeon]